MADENKTGSRGAAYWQQQMTNWEKSGSSQREFCRRHGLAISTFSYWRRKLSASARTGLDSLVAIQNKPAAPRQPVKISLGNSSSIIVEFDFNPELLLTVISALQGRV